MGTPDKQRIVMLAHRSCRSGMGVVVTPVLDLLHEVRPPFSPEGLVEQLVELFSGPHVRTLKDLGGPCGQK